MSQSNNQVVGIVEKILLRNPVINFFSILIKKIPIVSDLSNHFASIFFKSLPSGWHKLFFVAGSAAITLASLSYLRKLVIYSAITLKHNMNLAKISADAIKNKYGDCWIAITGFTEGIGWAFVHQLLKLNIKLVLIGRNKQKIQKKVKLLKQKFPNSQLKIVIGDLSKVNDIKSICSELQTLSKEIDIGVLINNAGASGHGQFFKSSPQSMLDISQTNWTSMFMINRTMIPIMCSRSNRSGIINISSCTGKFISPHLLTYPASKRMVNVYSQFLQRQNSDKIDVLLAMPFGVTTPMMRMSKSYATITPDNCARSIIGDLLSGSLITHGGLNHKIFGEMFNSLTQKQSAQRFQKFWKNFK